MNQPSKHTLVSLWSVSPPWLMWFEASAVSLISPASVGWPIWLLGSE
jgi:hypothetical protein